MLVLSCYTPTLWHIDRAPDVAISQIILNGYYPQEITGVDGIPVLNRSGYLNWLGAYAYAWPATSGGSDTPKLVATVEDLTGGPLASFTGVYRATDFTIVGSPVPEPAGIVLAVTALVTLIAARRTRKASKSSSCNASRRNSTDIAAGQPVRKRN